VDQSGFAGSDATADVSSRRTLVAGLALVAAGLLHLLAPRLLLWLARHGYRLVLRVHLHPGEQAPRRVRAVGVGMVALGIALLVGHRNR
jgi:hypothetical protein